MSVWAKFKEAWVNRKQFGDSNKTRDLAAFLPAALEIQESPQNPIAKWLGRSLIIFFTLILLWVCIGEVNIVASAEGKIIPSSRIKKIQPLEKAIVKKILVIEGEYVTAGQPLIELDSTLTHADKSSLTGELRRAKLRLSVDQSLIESLKDNQEEAGSTGKEPLIKFTAELFLNQGDEPTSADELVYRQLLQQQWEQYNSQRKVLESTLIKTKAEQAATQESVIKLQKTLPIVNRRAEKMQQLLAQNFASEDEFLVLEQERIEMMQDLKVEKQRYKQLQAAELEVEGEVGSLLAQTRAQALLSITDNQRQIATLREDLAKAVDIDAKQILYSPVSGRVQELVISTIGGVVTEAQELMSIVPDEEKLEVEVFLENNDIGFVREGMSSEVKIHTFPFTKYGIIDAEIINVSDDAILDEERGLIYGMQLVMKKNTLLVNGKELKLMPGMAVTAEVQIGYRKIIEFFLAPLLRYSQEGLRER
jgi:hemolysin D